MEQYDLTSEQLADYNLPLTEAQATEEEFNNMIDMFVELKKKKTPAAEVCKILGLTKSYEAKLESDYRWLRKNWRWKEAKKCATV